MSTVYVNTLKHIFIPVDCLDPTPENGQTTPSQPSYTDGTTVTFSCNPGYILKEAPRFTTTSTCHVNYGYYDEYYGYYYTYDQAYIHWDPSPPQCEGNT